MSKITADAIRRNEVASTAADAKDWAACSAAMIAKTIAVNLGRVGGKESLSAIIAAGADPNAVIGAMRAVPVAAELLNTLTVSGVDWVDAMTVMIMSGLVEKGLVSQPVVDAMQALSLRYESTASQAGVTDEDCTATDCEAAIGLQSRHKSLAEAYDAAQHAIEATPLISQSDLLTVISTRLGEVWS